MSHESRRLWSWLIFDVGQNMNCVHELIYDSLDRWRESHWHIHQIERYYHQPELFRYSVNSFIRAAKEVPQLLMMELQRHPKYASDLKPLITTLTSTALYSVLKKKRDFIVHQGSLELLSKGSAGITEGRGFKMGLTFRIEPWESSDDAYERFKAICRQDKDFRAMFGPDEDSVPCVERTWLMEEFPAKDLFDVTIEAWEATGATLSKIVITLGGEAIPVDKSCLHSSQKIRMKRYSQQDFVQSVDNAK